MNPDICVCRLKYEIRNHFKWILWIYANNATSNRFYNAVHIPFATFT